MPLIFKGFIHYFGTGIFLDGLNAVLAGVNRRIAFAPNDILTIAADKTEAELLLFVAVKLKLGLLQLFIPVLCLILNFTFCNFLHAGDSLLAGSLCGVHLGRRNDFPVGSKKIELKAAVLGFLDYVFTRHLIPLCMVFTGKFQKK